MAGGFALALALAPGTAWAEDEPPTPTPPESVTDLVEGEQGSEQAAAEEQPSEEAPEPPPFELPPEVVAALQQFADQAGISEECVTGVTESLELIGNGIAGLPAELEQLATDLGAAIQESIDTQSPTPVEDFLAGLAPEEGSEGPPAPPVGGDITAGLQQLADTLASEACQPAPPAEEPTENPQQPPASYQPPPSPPAPAPQPPPVQQAVYPGYAPTGAEDVDDEPSPVAIGMALVVLAGGALWTGRRWRAAHR